MSPNKQNLTIRVPADTYREFEKYRGDDVSKADAGRRLLEAGLERKQSVNWLYDFLSTSGSMLAVASVVALLAWGATWKVLTLALLTVATNGVAIAVGRGWL